MIVSNGNQAIKKLSEQKRQDGAGDDSKTSHERGALVWMKLSQSIEIF